MTCAGLVPTFRLLDYFAGWDEGRDAFDLPLFLDGIDDAEGLRLALLNPDAVEASEVDAYLPPPRLARGCGPCDWFLVTPAPPAPRLLRWDACECRWTPVWQEPCAHDLLIEPVALASRRRRLAVADAGARKVFVWSQGGARLAAEISLDALDETCAEPGCNCGERPAAKGSRGGHADWNMHVRGGTPGPLAFTNRGELLVAIERAGEWGVFRFGPVGEKRGVLPALPGGEVRRLAVDAHGGVWVLMERSGVFELWRQGRDISVFERASLEELRRAFTKSNLTAAATAGFCFERRDESDAPVVCCFSWYGRRLCDDEISVSEPEKYQRRGQLLTRAIDSGVPRCRWHRVRLDADLPPGTGVEVAISTSETDAPGEQGDPSLESGWESFPAGVPNHADWQKAPAGALDFLLNGQPPGRYLFVRLRLTGDGRSTPRVRRVRLDFPRATSLDLLPAVYRENPDAEDFGERFLSLFDSALADLDSAIERYPALLDPQGVPEEVLPWLGSFLDVSFDRAWGSEQRRAILKAVPELYRLRGTVEGLALAVRLVFGFDPVIQEAAAERMWGAVAKALPRRGAKDLCADEPEAEGACGGRLGARLGEVRLFGRASARFRVGRSKIGGTPLLSFGNPDNDPLNAGAYRFRVLAPPPAGTDSALWRERLQRLIESQKPAHTVASLHVGGSGFVLGAWSAVGVDTTLTPLAPPVLGREGNVRLRRMSVLWPGRRGGRREGISVGQTAVVGMQTLME